MASVNITGFHHFTLMTRDLEKAAPFYDTVLGLTRKHRPFFESKGIWYDIAGQELHLIETEAPVECHDGHPALEVSDIKAAIAACLAGGAIVQRDVFPRPHDDSLSAYVKDPDGNLIELCQHR